MGCNNTRRCVRAGNPARRAAASAGKPAICRSTFMRAEEIEQERSASGWNPYEGEEEPELEQPGSENGTVKKPEAEIREPDSPEARSGTFSDQQPERWSEGWSQRHIPEAWEMEPGAGQNYESENPEEKSGAVEYPEAKSDAAENPQAKSGAAENPEQAGADRTAPEAWQDGSGEKYPPHASCTFSPGSGSAWEREADLPYPLRWMGQSALMEEELRAERDLRMLQSMYPNEAKRLLPYIEEACDRMEYEGSAMFDEYPDLTTVYRIREELVGKLGEALPEENTSDSAQSELYSMQYRRPGNPDPRQPRPDSGPKRQKRPGQSGIGDLVQIMLLNEMHRRRCRHRTGKSCCGILGKPRRRRNAYDAEHHN